LFGQVAGIAVIDLADRVMASVLDKTFADIIQGHIEQQSDINFKLQTNVCEVVQGEHNVNRSNQGETAGFNMTRTEIKAPATFAMNAISFFGLRLISAGVIGTSKEDVNLNMYAGSGMLFIYKIDANYENYRCLECILS
jgi:hypothetical protein